MDSPNPLGEAAATEDLVPVAVRAMGAGAATAVAWVAAVLWIALLMIEPGGGPHVLSDFDPDATYANIVLFGLIPTPIVAGFTTDILMYRVRDAWRRVGLVMVAVMAGCVIAMFATIVVRETLGAPGLLGLALVALALALLAARSARAATARLSRPA